MTEDMTETKTKDTTTKHTAGPWHYGEAFQILKGDTPCEFRGIGNGAVHIGYASITGAVPDPEAEANARLIAAAPELLEACEAALEYLNRNRPKGNIRDNFTALNEHENGVVKPLRAAIAKAKGGQP